MGDTDVSSFYPPNSAIEAYFRWASHTTHAPEVFHLGAILPAISYEAARRGLTLGPEREVFRLMFALVSGPGSAKTTAKNLARHFVQRFYSSTLTKFERADPYVALRGSLSGVLTELGGMARPDGTTPVIFDLDELGQILKHDDAEDVVNQLYDGETYTRHLIRLQQSGGQGKAIEKPRVNGVFCATPSALEKVVTAAQVEGGLFSRILWLRDRLDGDKMQLRKQVWPEGERYAHDYWYAWKQMLDGAYELHPEARTLRTTAEAEQYLEDEVWPGVKAMILREDRHSAAAARLIHHVQVVSACYALACLREPRPAVIELSHVQTATRFVNFADNTAEGLSNRLAVPTLARLAETIELVLLRAPKEGVAKSALYKPCGRPMKHEMDLALQTLEDAGRIERYLADRNGRSATVFRVRQDGSESFAGPDGTAGRRPDLTVVPGGLS